MGGGVTYALEASENTTTITTKYERDDNLDFGKEEITETNETTDKGKVIHKVIKKGTKPTKEVTKQPFNVHYEENTNLDYGQRTETEGQEGTTTITTTYILNPDGTVIPQKGSPVVVDPVDKIITVGTKAVEREETIPHKTEYYTDVFLKYGERRIYKNGWDGKKVIRTAYILNKETGEVTEDTPREIIKEYPRYEVVFIGTKPENVVEKEVELESVYEEDESKELGTLENVYSTSLNELWGGYGKSYRVDKETGEISLFKDNTLLYKYKLIKDNAENNKIYNPNDLAEDSVGRTFSSDEEFDEYFKYNKTPIKYELYRISEQLPRKIVKVGTKPTEEIINEDGKQYKITTYYQLINKYTDGYSYNKEPKIRKVSKDEILEDGNIAQKEPATLTINYLEEGTNKKIKESIVLDKDLYKNDTVYLNSYGDFKHTVLLKNETFDNSKYNLIDDEYIDTVKLNNKENEINYYYKKDKTMATVKFNVYTWSKYSAFNNEDENTLKERNGKKYYNGLKYNNYKNTVVLDLPNNKIYNLKAELKKYLEAHKSNSSLYNYRLAKIVGLEDIEIKNELNNNKEIYEEYKKDIGNNKILEYSIIRDNKIVHYRDSEQWESDNRLVRDYEVFHYKWLTLDEIDGDFDTNKELTDDYEIDFYISDSGLLMYRDERTLIKFPHKIEPLVEPEKSEYNKVLGVNGISEDGELLPPPIYERSNLEVVIIKNKNNEVIDVFDASDKDVTDKIKAKYGDGVLKEDEDGEKVYIVEKDIEPSNTLKYIVTPIYENGKLIFPPIVEIPEYTETLSKKPPVDTNGDLILPPTYNKEEYTQPISTNTPIDSDGNLILSPVVDVPEYKNKVVNTLEKDNKEKVIQYVIDKPISKNFDTVYNKQDVKKSDSDSYINKVEKNIENDKVVQKQNLPKTNALNSTTYILGLLLSTIGFKRNKQE